MGAKPSTPIHDASIYEVPVLALVPYRGNPRVGDVGAIAESLEANGQYRPIVVRRETREVLAGNHTLEAAKHLGWDSIKVTYVEGITDEAAARIVLADNRLPDLGRYNIPDLTELLEQVGGNLTGTGYDNYFVSNLLASLDKAETQPVAKADRDETSSAAEPIPGPDDDLIDGVGGICPTCQRPLEV